MAKMWNSSSNCMICYKLYTLNENWSGQGQSEEYREKLLKVSSVHLFNELCDFSSIPSKDPLPFCSECTQGIENISIWDDKYNNHKKEISDFSGLFAIRVLRSRNSRRETGFNPEILGDVTVKGEKGIDGDEYLRFCKICHEMYKRQNQVLDFSTADKIVNNCKKYLFSEIFDSGSLDVNSIMTLKFLPFCLNCCQGIQELCQKNDLNESILGEISRFVNDFTIKVLNYRKYMKSFEYSAAEKIRIDIAVPSNNFSIIENPIPIPVKENIVEPPVQDASDATDEDECMIVDVIPLAGLKKNDFNSLCNKLKGNQNTTMKPEPSSPDVPNKIGDLNDSSEHWSSVIDFKKKFAGGFPRNSENPPTLSPIVISTTTMNYVNTGKPSLGVPRDPLTPCFSDASVSPSGRNRHHREINGAFKCQNCGMTFKYKINWHKHINSCFDGSDLFQCETCDEHFSDAVMFTEHVNSHKTPVPPKSKVKKLKLFRCKLCTKYFETEEKLNVHHEKHTKIRPFKCTVCKRSFLQSNHLWNHLRKNNICNADNYLQLDEQTSSNISAGAKRVRSRPRASARRKRVNPFSAGVGSGRCRHFMCKMCPMTFKVQQVYSDHLQTHYDIADANIRCDICRKVFSTKINRRWHFENKHPSVDIKNKHPSVDVENETVVKEMKFKSRPKRGKKVKKRQKDEDRTYKPSGRPRPSGVILHYNCGMCHAVFTEKRELSKHLQTHYDIAKYRCTLCKIVFSTSRPLHVHMTKVHGMKILEVGHRRSSLLN